MPANKKKGMSENLKALKDRLPPEMENEPRIHIMSLLKKGTASPKARNAVKDIGWTAAETADARSRLASFEEDWDAPGMDKYDQL